MRQSAFTFTLLIGVLLYLAAPTAAQSPVTVDLGFKAGVNVANVSHEHIDNTESKTLFAVGGYLTINIAETFAIQPEMLYTQKGTKFELDNLILYFDDGSSEAGSADIGVKASYLEIPVLFKLKFPTQTTVSPYLTAGPALAIKLSATNEIDWRTVSGLSGSESEDDEDIKSTDFGMVFGGGLDLAVGTGQLGFEARYTLGLSSVDNNNDGEEEDVKNRVFSFMVGYSFPVGPR